MTRNYFCLLILLLIGGMLPGQVTLRITAVPANTPEPDILYVAGNFNNWQPGDPAYALAENADGTFEITFAPAPGTLEYKFTRGSWATVEGNANGGFRPNRTLSYTGQALTAELEVLSWEDLGGGNNGTATDNVTVLAEDFYMPQLDRNRRIWVYLPPDYAGSDRSYPVLYMQDGQNVFDAATSFAGEWQVDESLNALFEDGDEGIIVVAIDNGGAERINEYSPWINPQYGGGQGEAYTDFIVETLKPHIDSNFRTLPDREHTGIMGSSLGGLISLYAAVEHQSVFSKAGIFSPSLWFSSEAFAHVSATGRQEDMRFFLLAGENEGGTVVSDLYVLYNTLLNAGFSEDELQLVTHTDGQHSEWYWAREFPDAYLWLFAGLTNAINGAASVPSYVRLYPIPADDVLHLESTRRLEEPRLQIFSMDGRIIQADALLEGNTVRVSSLQPGVYFILIYDNGHVVGSQRIIKQ